MEQVVSIFQEVIAVTVLQGIQEIPAKQVNKMKTKSEYYMYITAWLTD